MTIIAARYATINGVPLDTYAWEVVGDGYDPLLNIPSLRGDDVVMPGAVGRRAYPRVIDAAVVSLPLQIHGGFDQDGGTISDSIQGMLQHQEYLSENLGLPGTSGVDADRGTVPMVFVRSGSLSNWTGEVTVLALTDWRTLGNGDAMWRIDLSIPLGRLVEGGS